MTIKSTPRKTRTPKIGEIFFGEEEFIIGREKANDKNIIEVALTKEQCMVEGTRQEEIMSKGKLFIFDVIIKTDCSIIDESRKCATYIIENVKITEKVQLLHSVLPKSYLITARKMKNSKIDPNGEVIEFYTYGNFENTYRGEIEVIGKYIKK